MAAPNIEVSSNPTTTGGNASGVKVGLDADQTLGFYGSAGVTKPAVTGSLTATSVTLSNLITALDNLGLIDNNTTP